MVVDRFFTWVAEATVEQKLRAVDALVAALGDARIGEDVREAIEAALLLVADDPDIAVRRRLAAVLAEVDTAPRHLLLTLLDDHPSVAVAIAARSRALIDAELVDVVAHGVDEIRRAVAGRGRVGPTVATALAEAGDREACVTLLDNPGADVPAIGLERIVERFGEFAEIRRALLARPHVPITVRHRVLEKLAEAMENLVVVKSWMGRERAEATTRDSREKATIALAGSAGDAETVVLVEHLRRTGQLTTRLLLRAACIGNLRFVEEALARLADVPSSRVAALVADGRESALRALYRRAAMPDRARPAFHAAIEVHRELLAETGGFDGRPGDRARFSRRLVERVLTRFTAFERRDSDDLLVLLRRYAADAARDHVRHVMTERMAEAGRALAPPTPAAVVAEEAAASEGASTTAFAAEETVEAALAGAVAVELGVALADEGFVDPVVVEAEVVAPETEAHHIEDEEDEFVGLFAHVRPEDLPPEWLVDEVAPEAIFGDDDFLVRRTVVSEARVSLGEETPVSTFETAGEMAEVETLSSAPIRDADAMAMAEPDPGPVVETAAEAEPAEEASETFVDGLRAALDAVLHPPRRAA
ncbi:MAG: DUF2336 domain-containing protein [Siculibacillus sp.]|nr:DUF2336 domain-containing protein [Siculibacillus sp.]